MNELMICRQTIDEYDDALTALFLQRMECVKHIGAIKRQEGLPIGDPAREDDILKRLLPQIPEPLQPAFTAWFQTLFAAARDLQEKENKSCTI